MTDYLGMLIAIGAVVAFSGFISYGGEADKTVKGALGVIMLSVLVSPLLSILGSLPELDIDGLFDTPNEDIKVEDSLYYKTAEENFCLGIERLLESELDVEADDIRVYTEGFDMTKMRAEKITVILSGKGVVAEYHRVVEIIEGEGFGECEVKLEFSG